MLKKSSLFLWIITRLGLLHASLFVLFWLTNCLFYADVNNFLFENLGLRWDYLQVALLFSLGIGVWSLVRYLSIRRVEKKLSWGAWLFMASVVLYLILFYGGLWVLFNQSPEQWVRLRMLVEYFRVLPDALILLGLVVLLNRARKWFVARFPGDASRIKKFRIACLVIFILLWSVPLMLPPASVYQHPLPPKPLIIAHRGASMLAPENTLAAAQRAKALGADGLEVDIRISLDGIPFVMHDYGLERTTDVALLFPDRKEDLPENFTLAELKRLNAGEWFFLEDPYHTIAQSLVSSTDAQEMRTERIPTLSEVLNFLKENNLVFIFDLLSPPLEHPYHAQFFDICLTLIHQVGFDSRVWFLANGAERTIVASTAPGMVLTYGADFKNPPQARELAEQGYQIVNVGYGIPFERIKQYQQAGMKVNLYVVDEPWMFSKAWLAGADSITTNNVHSMVVLDCPAFGLPNA